MAKPPAETGRRAAVKCRLHQAQRLLTQAGDAQFHGRPIRKNPTRPRRGTDERYPLKMPRWRSVDGHCFGVDRRPHLPDDERLRRAAANHAGRGEHRCPKPENFHTKLTSRRTATLRFNIVAAAVSRVYTESSHAIEMTFAQPTPMGAATSVVSIFPCLPCHQLLHFAALIGARAEVLFAISLKKYVKLVKKYLLLLLGFR
jgi:hypothetical protein